MPTSNAAMIHQTLSLKPNLKNVYSSIQQSQSLVARSRVGQFVSDSVSQGGVPKRRNHPSISTGSNGKRLNETDSKPGQAKIEIQSFNTITAQTPGAEVKRPTQSMGDSGIILNIEKPGDRNAFRVRKFSRSGSVSERSDGVRIGEDDEEARVEKLKQSIESEDEF